jgi:hypothetical protein
LPELQLQKQGKGGKKQPGPSRGPQSQQHSQQQEPENKLHFKKEFNKSNSQLTNFNYFVF